MWEVLCANVWITAWEVSLKFFLTFSLSAFLVVNINLFFFFFVLVLNVAIALFTFTATYTNIWIYVCMLALNIITKPPLVLIFLFRRENFTFIAILEGTEGFVFSLSKVKFSRIYSELFLVSSLWIHFAYLQNSSQLSENHWKFSWKRHYNTRPIYFPLVFLQKKVVCFTTMFILTLRNLIKFFLYFCYICACSLFLLLSFQRQWNNNELPGIFV